MVKMTTIEELGAEVAALRQRVVSSESVLAIQALKARYGELVDRRFSAGRSIDPDTLAPLPTSRGSLYR